MKKTDWENFKSRLKQDFNQLRREWKQANIKWSDIKAFIKALTVPLKLSIKVIFKVTKVFLKAGGVMVFAPMFAFTFSLFGILPQVAKNGRK